MIEKTNATNEAWQASADLGARRGRCLPSDSSVLSIRGPVLLSRQLSRLQDRHPHSLGLSDSPDLRFLPRLQLPHEAHVATLQDQGGATLGGEAGAGATVPLCGAVLDDGRGEHGGEATEGAVERFQ